MQLDFAVCAIADHDEDGHAQIQTDSPGIDGKQGTQPAETLLPLGFYSLPLDPEKGSEKEIGIGAPVLTLTSGDRRYVVPFNDPRDVTKLPKPRKGGRMLAGGAGDYRSFVIIDGLDPAGSQMSGSITVATPYAKDGSKKTLGLSMDVRTPGKESISFVHGEGQRITLSAEGSKGIILTAANGGSYLEVGDKGIVLAGKTKVQGSLTVGEQTAALPVALGPPLTAALTQIVQTIAAVAAAAGLTAAASSAAAAPLVASIAALTAKINALHLKSS